MNRARRHSGLSRWVCPRDTLTMVTHCSGQALHRLPARQREALVLRFFCDLSVEEIADAMGIGIGTVKSTTSRALAALGRMLGSEQ
ncbi:sigma-70 family RNA polymerase sigma factor [Actinomadura sp. BRA 177]|nr:sigma-70 family RNA polymerase sigma factor [Actinomadura sp. BRA 177]